MPAAIQLGNHEAVKVADSEECLGDVIRDFNAEMLLGIHHEFD
jgi:hypothetical protein